MFLVFERVISRIFGGQKTQNLRNARSATRWQQNNQFWEFHPFLTSKVLIPYIFNELSIIILEKTQRKDGAVNDFQPHF